MADARLEKLMKQLILIKLLRLMSLTFWEFEMKRVFCVCMGKIGHIRHLFTEDGHSQRGLILRCLYSCQTKGVVALSAYADA